MTVDEFLGSETDLQPVRQMAYGPVVGEYHHAAMFGPAGNALGPSDVAASPDTGFKQGDLIMAADGTLHTVADWSFLHPNQPTHNTIEFRDRKDQGHGFISKVNSIDDFLGGVSKPSVDVGNVTDAQGNVVGLPAGAVPQPPSNLPPEEQGLQNILEKNIAAGAQAGVYPKAVAATMDDRIAQQQAAESPPEKSFQEKALSFLEGKGSFNDLVAPAVTGVRRAFNLPTSGPISEQDIQESISGGSEAPLVGGKISREERAPQNAGQFVTKTAYNTVADLINFANTPTGAATIMATGGLSAGAQQLVALGFGAQAVKGSIDAIKQGDFSGALESLGIGFLAAKGAHEIGKAPEAKAAAPPEGFEVSPEQQGDKGFVMQKEFSPEKAKAEEARVAEAERKAQIEADVEAMNALEKRRQQEIIQPPPPEEPRVSPETGEAFPQYPVVPTDVERELMPTGEAPPSGEFQAKPRILPNPDMPPRTITSKLPITQSEYGQEIQSETFGDGGGSGQQFTPPPGTGRVAPPEIAGARLVTGEPVGVSQARTEAELGVGSVQPGAGAEMGSGLAFGRDYINKGGDPRLPIRRALASGLVGKNEVGVVHAELERLRMQRNQAAANAADHPDDPIAAERLDATDKAQRAWRRELQPVLTRASDALREAYTQSRSKPDVGSYAGLSNLIDEHFKGTVEPTPEQRMALRKVAKSVQESRAKAVQSVKTAADAAKSRVKKVMTPEQLHADLRKILETAFTDCII